MKALKVGVLFFCRLVLAITGYRRLSGTFAVALLATLSGGLLPAAYASDQRYADYHLKAAFILNFPNFITWPNYGDDAENTICAFSADAVADSIETLLASAQMSERKTRISFFRNPDIDVQCDLAFVGKDAESLIVGISAARDISNTLIVSDITNYAVDGGMIELALVDTRIRVILNRAVINSHGFKVDSRLLQLTTQVGTKGTQE
ncbi:YfiR family protein [Candidatus Litorirhabdus singularis]|nr:YfiR family protein [Candidatus Litorirhabdus singularis]